MNIAVFLPNWVGDVVMATPALRALREHFDAARLIGVCRPYVAGVLESAPWLDELLFLDRRGAWSQRWPALAFRLRRIGIDLAVLLTNSFRSGLVAWLGGCRRRVGFDRDARGWMLTDRLLSLRDESGRFKPTPVIDDYNRLAQAAGCAWPGHRMELFTNLADETAADVVCARFGIRPHEQLVLLNPGAAFGAAKHWPAQSFAQVAQALAQRGSKVLVLCGPSEKEQARAIVARAARPGVFSLADDALSLGLTKALVRRARLLVTTDSGPRHFAAAFNRPVVSLFGPTFIDWTRTYFGKEICLQREVPCGPCQLRVCPTDHACMRLLAPDEVLAASLRLLDQYVRKAS